MTDKFTEKEYVSKCCGGDVKWEVDTYSTHTQACGELKGFICQRCHKPCEIIEKPSAKEE